MPINFRNNDGKRKIAPPTTVRAAIDRIVNSLDNSEKRYILEHKSGAIHFTTGMAIRNEWGLWKENSPIRKDFIQRYKLFGHGDDVSGVILEGVWAVVHEKDVDVAIEKTVERFRKHWVRSGVNPETGVQEHKHPTTYEIDPKDYEEVMTTDWEIIQALQKENKRLQQWVNDLQNGTWVTCVYCGHRYGPQDSHPTCLADVLKEHVSKCPYHPMSELRQLVLDLWNVRDYGIPESELRERVQKAIPDEIIGYRPVNKDGISLTPEIKDGRVSYTHHFE